MDRPWTFLSFLKLGIALAAAGYAPLQLYILFGPRDGNPIGLGLLFVVGMFAGLGAIALGLARMLWQLFTDRSK